MNILHTCCAALSVAAIACREPTPPPPPDTSVLIVTPDAISLAAGQQLQLAAQANDPRGQPIAGAPIAYESEDAALLSVNEQGRVTALGGTGRTRVRVRSGSVVREIPATVTPGEPFALSKQSGDRQSAVATGSLPQSVSVSVVDAFGNPVPGSHVRFEVSDGGADPADALASAKGIAETRWTLGARAGQQELVASVDGASGAIRAHFTASATPSRLARLEAVVPAPEASLVAAHLSPRVRATDEFGNPHSGVAVLWEVAAGDGRVSNAVSETDADGVASTDWRLGERTAENVIMARADGLPGQVVELRVATRPGAPARLVALPRAKRAAPAVRVVDAFDNPVPAVLVRFRVESPGGQVASSAAMTDDAGNAPVANWESGAQVEARIQGDVAPLRLEPDHPAP